MYRTDDTSSLVSTQRHINSAYVFICSFVLLVVGTFFLFNPALAQELTSTQITSGYRDFQFTGGQVTSEPTEEMSESKLWHQDGFWWGVFWDSNNLVYRIHRLNFNTQSWVNVGPDVDSRPRSSVDCLSAGSTLYIVSRSKTTHLDSQGSAAANFYRFSYNASTQSYSLDAGFPVVINGTGRTHSMTVAKDSNGKLWVTWTANGKVMINRTDGTDTNWGTAFILPAQQNDLKVSGGETIDICAISAFGGNKIGIVWGNQNPDPTLLDDDRKYFFSVHNDSDGDTIWGSREDMLPGLSSTSANNPVSDDHIHIACDINNGLVIAALKTGLGGGSLPRAVVAKRAVSGSWTHAVVGNGSDDHTRPIVLYDSDVDSVYVFAKNGTASSAVIYMKTAHVNDLNFSSGVGKVFLKSDTDTNINNPTSTKQCVSASTGMLVAASDRTSDFYLHNYLVGGNARPLARRDNAVRHEDNPVAVNVLVNDADDGTIDVTSVTIITQPTNGTASVNSTTGAITYSPASGFLGTDSLKYSMKDNLGVNAVAGSLVITSNLLPTAANDAATTSEDQAVNVTVLSNDSDSDGTLDLTSVTIVTGANNGSTSVNAANGVVTYTPDPDFFGSDSFTYTVRDDDGGVSAAATVSVTVSDVNDAPVAHDDAATTNEDNPVVIGVLLNDTDVDGTLTPSTVTVVSAPSNGTTSTNTTTGEVTYSPDSDFFGTDSFTYTVQDDDSGVSNAATVTVSVSSMNDAPVANDDANGTAQGAPVTIAVLSNDSDLDGTLNPASVSVTSGPGNGATSINPTTGEITYTPDSGFFGTDSFTYTVQDDSSATSNTATVTVSTDGTPVANADSAFTIKNNSVVINVTGNDTDPDGVIDPATVTLVSAPSSGGTAINPATGEITYFPFSGFFGLDSFTYTVQDESGTTSNQATVTVDVNNPPVAVNDTTSTAKETPVVITVTSNDSDADGTIDATTVTITSSPLNGSASVNPATGVITYTPNPGTAGFDILSYTVRDNDGAVSNTATVLVKVNNTPVAQNDAATTNEDTPIGIDLRVNDFDIDGTLDPASITIITAPANGATALDAATGIVTYSPAANFFGSDTFTYTVDDNNGAASNQATVNVTIQSVNDAPVAGNDALSTAEETAGTVAVLGNDNDVDGSLIPGSVTITTPPTHGPASVNPSTGEITYTPELNFVGTDSLTYTVDDNDGASSNTSRVLISVSDVNDAPVAVDDSSQTDKNMAVTINVATNDTDIDGNVVATTVAVAGNPANGVATVDGSTGEITYTPNTGFVGNDSFTYTVDDEDGATSNQATVQVSVNDLPVATNDAVVTNEDNSIDIDVAANDLDSDGTVDPTSVVLLSNPTSGGIALNNTTGIVTYTPNTNFFGSDSFTYRVNDNRGATSNVATVSITVNKGPIAVSESAVTDEDVAISLNVIGNDIDLDGTLNPASVTIVTGVTNGTTSLDATTGAVTYTPNAHFFGSDSFTYTVDDNNGATSNLASVSLTINSVNDAPIVVNDTTSTVEDTPVIVNVPANDSDVDGSLNLTSVTVATPPANGSASVNPSTGAITYSPDANFNATDSFTYTIADNNGAASNPAAVVVTVSSVNDAPVAVDDAVTTPEDTPIIVSILANDTDVDDTIDASSLSVLSNPTNGTTAIDGAIGTITYTPAANFNGSDTFTYTVDDQAGATSNVATATITVTSVNDPPVAQNDSAATTEEDPVVIAVVTNDSDLDGNLILTSVTVATPPANGSTTVAGATGEITYSPDVNFFGTDTLTYTVDDNEGASSNAARVVITVGAENDAPVAVNDTVSTAEDTPLSVAVMSNDNDVDGTLNPASVTIVTAPSNGNATVDGVTGEITYSPSLNFFGQDLLTYRVSDNVGVVSDDATVFITITSVNDPPVAVNDTTSTDEDTQVVINVPVNDSDVDGSLNTGSVAVAANPATGSTSINGLTGQITYTPAPNFFGTDTFTYTINDDGGETSNAASVIVNVNDINDSPVAADDAASTNEDTPVSVAVLVNDADLDGSLDATSVTVAAQPTNGGTAVDGVTGAITYTPNTDFSGSDSFTYTVNDDDGGSSNAATVTITVSAVNDAPVAVNDTSNTNEDTPVTVAVAANDFDVDGAIDPATVSVVNNPGNGNVSVDNSTGQITYTPNQNFFGTETFTYFVKNTENLSSNVATVVIHINPVNDPPVANDDSATTPEDTPVVIDVEANDNDVDGSLNVASVTVVSPASNGSLSVDPVTGDVTYSPNVNFFGSDAFTYTIEDDSSAVSNVATVAVSVTAENDVPAASDDSATTPEEQAVVIDVTLNDNDPDGSFDLASLTIVSGPSNGSTNVDVATGLVSYAPDLDFFGADTFTYTIDDNLGATSNTATVSVTVTPVNDPPIALNDTTITIEDEIIVIDVLANDTDIDGTFNFSSFNIVFGPLNGSVVPNPATGELTYTPNTDFSGAELFMYTVEDDSGAASNAASVAITVVELNDIPTAVNDTTSTVEDTPVVIDVLANDSDADGLLNPARVRIAAGPANGLTSIDAATGMITYSPNANFFGLDTFTYTVDDTLGLTSDPATVFVTLTPVDDPPFAVNDTTSTPEDTPVIIDVLANDIDFDAPGTIDPTSVSVTSGTSNGSVSVDVVTGKVTYSPDLNFFGADSFAYTVQDNDGFLSNPATVFITVTTVNDNPVAVNDTTSTPEDTPVVVDVGANDSDLEGTLDFSSVSVATAPANGSTSINVTTGEITYTPALDFFGQDSFTYTIADNQAGVSNPATVVINITNVNDAPVAVNDTTNTPEDATINIAVTANDRDVDGSIDNSTLTIISAPANGSAVLGGTPGEVTYSPNPNFVGQDSFTYSVKDDSSALSNTATVLLNVSGENDAPVVVNDTTATPEDTQVVIDVLNNDSDVEGGLNPASVTVVSLPNSGSTTVDATTGEITYSPDQNFNGADSFQYTATDNGGLSNSATVLVTVSSVNDAPVAVNDTTNTAEETPAVIAVITNDSDVDGSLDATSVTVATQPANGAAAADGTTGAITYTPNLNFEGQDTFTYTVKDDSSTASNTATVVVNVSGQNDAPVAINDTSFTLEDSPVVINGPGNDSDVDGTLDLTSVAVATQPGNGSTAVDATTGAITYTPAADFNGTDTFSYTILDNLGASSNVALVIVTVPNVNDAPVALNDTTATAEDNPVAIDVAANDTDVDGTVDVATVTVVSTPSNGLTAVDGSGVITYTPNAHFFGTDTFTYTVEDDSSAVSNTATVVVNVNSINDAPVAQNDTTTTAEDTPAAIAVTTNDSDIDGALSLSSVAVVTQPTDGATVIDGTTGVITYIPNANFEGQDTFTYTVNDDSAATSNAATVLVNITSENDNPVAVNDTSATQEDTPATIAVAANDSDVDGNLIFSTVTVITASANGATAVNPTTGEITYTPSLNFNGTDTFSYSISDNLGAGSNLATVTINVASVNDAPVAVNDTTSTAEEAPVQIPVTGNDSDVDGDLALASVTVRASANNGSTSVDPATGVITYTPSTNFVGQDSFTYTVEDDSSAISDSAAVVVNVSGENDAPVAINDTTLIIEDTPTPIPVTVNDSDVDGTLDLSTLSVVTNPANGNAAVNGTSGHIIYTPNQDFNGPDSFSYRVSDNEGRASNIASVLMTVSGVNDAAAAVNDTVTTDEDTPAVIDVLANDNDVDGFLEPSSVTITDAPSNGVTAIDNSTGAITYTPAPHFFGLDTLAYTVDDDEGATSNPATVFLTVSTVNDPPQATDDIVSTNEDTPVTIDVLANDSDVDGTINIATLTLLTTPNNGFPTINTSTGEIVYAPNANFNGSDSFTYTIEDDLGATSNTGTITVTVVSINDAPVAGNDASLGFVNTPLVIDVLVNDSDIDGSIVPASVTVVTSPNNGTTSVNIVNGEVTYTPFSGFSGTDSFIYTVQDNGGLASNPATVNFSINQSSLSFNAADDAYVNSANVTQNTGTLAEIRARVTGSSLLNGYLKFNVSGVSGTIESAKVRLFVTDPSNDGGSIRVVDNHFLNTNIPWTETGITFSNAPNPSVNTALASVGPALTGQTVELDVTAAITGDGVYSFVITGNSNDAVRYSSRQGSTPPQLVLQLGSSGALIPAISSFSPGSGPSRSEVTITGSNFIGVTQVSFNGVPAAFSVDSVTRIRATVPTGAGSGFITVTNGSGAGNSSSQFAVTNFPAITSFSPTSGIGTTEVTITGNNFNGATAVTFNGAPATSFVTDSNTQIRAVVPAAATTGPIAVTNSQGTGSGSSNFTVIQPPAMTSFSPTNGPIGTEVTVIGSDFFGTTLVTFDGVSATFSVVSNTEIQATVPVGAGSGAIIVINPAGVEFSSEEFLVTNLPGITSFTPTSGLIGVEVTVAGGNFTGTTDVSFNGTTASFTVDSDSQLRANVPIGATTGPISVTNGDGTTTSTGDFTVLSLPSIASFAPTAGFPGSQITLTGSGFAGATDVSFNGTAASFLIDSDTQIRADVPSNAATGLISVTNSVGTAAGSSVFTVLTPSNQTLTFNPTDDSFIITSKPTTNYGSVNNFRVRKTRSFYISYLKFNVSGVNGPVQSAVLRLFAPDGSDDGGSIFSVSNNVEGGATPWTETGLLPGNAPAITGSALSSAGLVTLSSVVEFDVTAAITGNGTFSLAIRNQSSDAVRYTSKEGSNVPELVVTTGSGGGGAVQPPAVASFTPTSGPVGAQVTITGANFTGTTQVSFNGTATVIFAVDSDSQIRVSVPSGATSGLISVTNSDGTGASASNFTVSLPPTITSFTPTSGFVASEVTLAGSNFTGSTAVAFNGVSATTFTVDSDHQIRATVSLGATTGPVSVTNSSGTAFSPSDFTVTITNVPIIASFTPTSGVIGSEVTFTGTNFTGTTAVAFNGIPALFSFDSDTHIRATVPSGAATGPVSVTNGDGTGISAGNFTVVNPPAVSSFTPAMGFVGSEVTVAGSNFTGVTTVAFNGSSAATFTVDSDSQIRATVPSGATTGPVSVTNPAGTAASASDFTVDVSSGETVTFNPIHDSFVRSSRPTRNYGSSTQLRVRLSSSDYDTYLKFNITGLTASVQSAILRLFVIDAGTQGGSIHSVSNNLLGTAIPWTEGAIIFNNAPSISGPALSSVGAVSLSQTVEFDVTAAITGNGTFSFAITNNHRNTVKYSSKEGVSAPELIVTTGSGGGISNPPVISSFGPASGPVGSNVTVLGSNFTGATAVSFNGTAAASFTVDSGSQLRATVPSGATTGLISVTNSDGTGASATSFTVTIPSPPAITSFTPLNGPVGTEVTVLGSNFTGATAVSFNGTAAASFTVDSGNQLRATVPSGATTGLIGVTNSDGAASSTTNFTVTVPSPPTIASFTPTSGPVGTEVTALGSNFSGTTSVSFNGTAASSFTVDSDNQLRAVAPIAATTGPLSVTNSGGTAASAANFTVTVTTLPTIASFTPASGIIGSQVTVSGANFTGTTNVSFNGTPAASFTVDSDNQVRATVPVGAATGPISVTTNEGTAVSAGDFSVISAPTISSFSPTNGPVGTQVTLGGGSFLGATVVTFNGVSASTFTVDSDSQISATVPSGATTGLISVTNAAGTAASAADFTVDTASGGETLTFLPTDDAFVRSTRANNNYEHSAELRVRLSSTDYDSYLKFNVTGLTAAVQSAVLRLFVIDDGTQGGSVFSASNNFLATGTPWSEVDLTFNNAPGVSGSPLSTVGAVSLNQTVEFDVTAAITGNGVFSFVISNNHSNTVKYSSKDGTVSPQLIVTTGSGGSSSHPPSITSFTPSSGPVATTVTLSGSNFTGTTLVTFNGATASFTVDSSTQVRASVPAGATSGALSVTNSDGTATSSSVFTVTTSGGNPPSVASFTPASGAVATEVTITGSDFTGVTSVAFNGATAPSFTFDSDSQIRANVPSGATTGPISVTNPAGTGTSGSNFTVSSGGGSILTFQPTDDAQVKSTLPAKNYGNKTSFKLDDPDIFLSYLKFNVQGVSGSVQSAKIRLFVNNGSVNGGSIFSVSNNFTNTATPWHESGLVHANAPTMSGSPLSSLAAVGVGETVEFDVTAAITGDGIYSFGLSPNSTNLVEYSSKEGANPPQLVIDTGSGLPKENPDASEGAETELDEPALPEQIALFPNYPNPFNAGTSIEYALPRDVKVTLGIFNLRGQLVRVLVDGKQKAGIKRVHWNGRNGDDNEVGSGVYFLRLEAGEHKFSRKITLQK